MKLIYQEEDFGCGAACVAMLSGRSYNEATRLIQELRGELPAERFGRTKVSLLKKAFENFQLTLGQKILLEGHHMSKRARLNKNKGNALLRTSGNSFHWMVWDGEKRSVRNPERDVKYPWCEIIAYYPVRTD